MGKRNIPKGQNAKTKYKINALTLQKSSKTNRGYNQKKQCMSLVSFHEAPRLVISRTTVSHAVLLLRKKSLLNQWTQNFHFSTARRFRSQEPDFLQACPWPTLWSSKMPEPLHKTGVATTTQQHSFRKVRYPVASKAPTPFQSFHVTVESVADCEPMKIVQVRYSLEHVDQQMP